jgi:hypothetical protein
MSRPPRSILLTAALALAAMLTAPALAQWPGRFADGHLAPRCQRNQEIWFNRYPGGYQGPYGGPLCGRPFHYPASRQLRLYKDHLRGRPSRPRWSYWWMDEAPPAPVHRDRPRAGAIDSGSGWRLLAADRPAAALRVFARQAAADPRAGRPRIGYALASALTGDLATSASALRRAFRVDPDAIHDVTVAGFRDQLQPLVHEHEPLLEAEPPDADAAIVVTTVAFLLGDMPTARYAAARLQDARGPVRSVAAAPAPQPPHRPTDDDGSS